MPRASLTLAALAALFLTASLGHAAPANKCVVNGATTYQQGPCSSGQAGKLPTVEELNANEKKRRSSAVAAAPEKVVPAAVAVPSFSCDGRTHCSQMRSCAEAKFFLANCPGAKMDGDRNGIPCEQQWCTR